MTAEGCDAHRPSSRMSASSRTRLRTTPPPSGSLSMSNEITIGEPTTAFRPHGRGSPQSEILASGPPMTIANLPGSAVAPPATAASSNTLVSSPPATSSTYVAAAPMSAGKHSPPAKGSLFAKQQQQQQPQPAQSFHDYKHHRQEAPADHQPATEPHEAQGHGKQSHQFLNRRQETFDIHGWPEGIERPRRFLGMRVKPVSQWSVKHIFCLSY